MGPPADPPRAKEFLDQSAEGTTVSIFHLEAGIALYHCSAKSYAETDWPAILRLYDAMLTIHRSPVYLAQPGDRRRRNRRPRGHPRAGRSRPGGNAARHYHLFDATLGELYRRAGDFGGARTSPQSRPTKDTITP